MPHIEKASTFFLENERNRIRNKIQENLRKIEIHSKDSEDIKELMKLKNNEEIACIHTDKTGKIVILNRNDYINLMENTFAKMQVETINKDPNMKIQNFN